MNLNNRCVIERKVITQDTVFGSEIITWTLFQSAWCDIQDVMPSRDERVKNDMAMSSVRSRIRLRYRTDIDSSMRFVIFRQDETIWNIIGGPGVLGNKQWVEFLIERTSI